MRTDYYEQIMIELKDTSSKFDEVSIEQLSEAIIRSNRIFLAGTGRSGLMVKAFAMRLMHLGLNAFVVGETTTPGICNRDLLIIGSGSGETGSVSIYAGEARKHNAKIALITIFPNSTIGKLADFKVLVSAPTSKNILDNGITSIQPMGSLFEQSLMILLDGLILRLIDRLDANPGAMVANHANLE